MALLRKMTCNVRHPMSLCHPVIQSCPSRHCLEMQILKRQKLPSKVRIYHKMTTELTFVSFEFDMSVILAYTCKISRVSSMIILHDIFRYFQQRADLCKCLPVRFVVLCLSVLRNCEKPACYWIYHIKWLSSWLLRFFISTNRHFCLCCSFWGVCVCEREREREGERECLCVCLGA